MNYLQPGTLTEDQEKLVLKEAKELLADIKKSKKVKVEDQDNFMKLHNLFCGTPWEKFSNCGSCAKRWVNELTDAVKNFEKLAKKKPAPVADPES